MTDMIEKIIREKPHLADPFRFYQKTLKFVQSIQELGIIAGDRPAYRPDVLGKIFDRFASLLELPEGTLSPLKQAMELGEIDFTRVPLGEIPSFSLPYAEDDLSMLLYLLSKPYFLAMREERRPEERIWDEGKCPLCNARPALTWISEDGRRKVSCSFCGTIGFVNRSGCLICMTVDKAKQDILVFEKEEGFRIETCGLCRSYVKTVMAGMHAGLSAEAADLMSLPLDIIAQQKGFMRRSPNPVGMRKITMQG